MVFNRKTAWVVLFILLLALLSGCTQEADVEGQEVKITIQGEELTGSYTGHIIGGKPDGEGTFEFVDGDNVTRYSGTFTGGSITGSGTLELPEYTISFQDNEYVGTFSGEVSEGIPEGTGSFFYEDSENYLRYTGLFVEGQPTWTGDIDTNKFTINIVTYSKDGSYNGHITDGIPDGQGSFTTVNSMGYEYNYDGEWKNGSWDGSGIWSFTDPEVTFDHIGTFKNFVFTPDFAELVNSLGTWNSMPYEVKPTSYAFMKSHMNLFPVSDVAALSNYLDETVEYKHLAKSIDPYLEKVVKTRGSIIDIYENSIDDETQKFLYSEMLLYDGNGDCWWGFYPGSLDYYEGDNITVYGLPIGASSFPNVSGGTTRVQVLALCYVTK